MIYAIGSIKGGVGKTTVSTSLAVIAARSGLDVLLVDADDQGTATDFTAAREATREEGSGYTAIQLSGAAVRSEVLKLSSRFDHVVIDVGGRDTAAQRAALSVANVVFIPFLPSSFDVWSLEKIASLIEEAKAYNSDLKAFAFVNRADSQGKDNEEAREVASEVGAEQSSFEVLDLQLGNRKAFRTAAASGLAVTELTPKDGKAVDEAMKLYEYALNM